MINAYVTGNLGNDAESKDVNGQTVIELSIASNDRRTDTTTWIRVSYWRKADKLLEYLTKGTKVGVRGELTMNESGDRTYVNMRADEIELLGGGGERDRSGGRDQRGDDRGSHRQQQQDRGRGGGGRDDRADRSGGRPGGGRDDQRGNGRSGGRDDRGGGRNERDTGRGQYNRQPDPDDDIPFD